MKKIAIILTSALIIAGCQTQSAVTTNEDGSLKYQVSNFEISYPNTFQIKKAKNNEATFVSEDKSVEFYIFSPEEPETNKYIKVGKKEELLKNNIRKLTKVDDPNLKEPKITASATVQALNKSYYRDLNMELPDFESDLVLYAFGIKYTNQEAYDKYEEEYQKFKESFIQNPK